MPTRRLELLQRIAFFATLLPAEREALAKLSLVHEFPAHVVLQPQNVVPESLFCLINGSVEIVAREDAASDTVAVVEHGSVFTLAGVLADTATLTEARTTRRSTVAIVPAPAIRTLIDTNHAFCKAAMLYTVQYSQAVVRKLHGQKMRTTTERLALWILERSSADGFVEIPYEKRTLASLLGTTPENLSRAFTALEAIVKKKDFKKYVVVDPAHLRKIARPSPLIGVH